jgi:hypothetical protein
MTLDEAANPWEGNVYYISDKGTTNVLQRGDVGDNLSLVAYASGTTSQQWSAEFVNGFFRFSAKESSSGNAAYMALNENSVLYVSAKSSDAALLVVRKDQDSNKGFELLVFQNISTCSGNSTITTPTLEAIDTISGTFKAVSSSTYRFGFTKA